MKTITAFQTSDDMLFSTKESAEKHEMMLSKENGIDDFLDSDINPYKGHAHRSMARNTIVSWELWKAKNEIFAK